MENTISIMPQAEISKLPELMKFEHLQKYLGFGRCKTLEIVHSGEIPYIKIGREFRFYASDVKAYLDSKRQVQAVPEESPRVQMINSIKNRRLSNKQNKK